jgi:hypothetical protein
MIQSMRQKLFAFAAAMALLASMPLSALADDQTPVIDGRLQGYGTQPVVLDAGGTALTYLLLVGLGVLCIGVMLKNAKRTHLD